MRFIHTADIHLGAGPDAGSSYSENRGAEIWDSFERLINLCEKEKIDILLIAGDLFHRQPLLRELKEVNYLFSRLTHTQVVLIAGNHDYLKTTSFYKTFAWCDQVHMLMGTEIEYVEFPELEACVYGLSYDSKEITEPRYDNAFPQKRQKTEILLAHGGDEKHIPFNRNRMEALGYDYVALGHIHRPGEILKDKICYAGALEPVDKNDTGVHGYIKGEVVRGKCRVGFVPFASREYIHLEVPVSQEMTSREVKNLAAEEVRARGVQNLFKIILTGFGDPDIIYDTESMDVYGNLLEVVNHTKPAYDFEKLMRQNEDNLLGKYIESLYGSAEGSVEYQALYEGVKALLETKRG